GVVPRRGVQRAPSETRRAGDCGAPLRRAAAAGAAATARRIHLRGGGTAGGRTGGRPALGGVGPRVVGAAVERDAVPVGRELLLPPAARGRGVLRAGHLARHRPVRARQERRAERAGGGGGAGGAGRTRRRR